MFRELPPPREEKMIVAGEDDDDLLALKAFEQLRVHDHVNTHTSHVTRHTSHATRHTSHVTRHTSHVTRHTSHVTRHTSHATLHTSHATRHTSHVTRHTPWIYLHAHHQSPRMMEKTLPHVSLQNCHALPRQTGCTLAITTGFRLENKLQRRPSACWRVCRHGADSPATLPAAQHVTTLQQKSARNRADKWRRC